MGLLPKVSAWSILGASVIALGATTSAAGLDLSPADETLIPGAILFTNSAFGGEVEGDPNQLATAISDGAAMGVTFYGWHGKLKAPCQDLTWTHRGDLRCSVEIWFNDSEVDDIPDRHGLRVSVHSTGRTSTMVLVPRSETGEVLIHSVEQSRSPVEWYVVEPGMPADDGAFAEAEDELNP